MIVNNEVIKLVFKLCRNFLASFRNQDMFQDSLQIYREGYKGSIWPKKSEKF